MKSKIQGALLGVMLGDALGMPVETMSRSAIVKALGPNGVVGFINPMQTRIDDTKHMHAGDTTDDWQLTSTVLRSLISSPGWVRDNVIRAHCDTLRTTTFGWGKGSVSSVQQIIDGHRDGTSPPPFVPNQGLGNGVMMKIAPLALYHALLLKFDRTHSLKAFVTQTKELGWITHSDPRAWIAAFAVGTLIIDRVLCAVDNTKMPDAFIQHVARDVELVERFFVDKTKDRILAQLLREIPQHIESSEQLVEKFGSRFNVLETMPFVIGTYLRHQRDFRAGVLEAVNAGGDTDTNASIVGALIGATVGIEGIPNEWRTFRPEFEEAITLGGELYELFS